MFCFITSLRSPTVSENWTRVCELFDRTLGSVFNQLSPNFKVVAVCHEVPKLFGTADERLEFIKVKFPVPEKTFESMLTNDKVPKLKVAMRRAREMNASYIMPIDADDLVSRQIVSYCLDHDVDGWVIRRGYRHEYGQAWIEKAADFNLQCGTCNILARRIFKLDDPMRERDLDKILFEDGHNRVAATLSARGVVIQPLPFPAAVYIVANGENSTRLALSSELFPIRRSRGVRGLVGRNLLTFATWTRRRPLTGAFRSEFSIRGSLES